MVPIIAGSKLTSAVRAPMRAATAAASTPACPPPTTMMSNSCMQAAIPNSEVTVKARLALAGVSRGTSLADAEPSEQRIKHVFCSGPSDQAIERDARQSQRFGREKGIKLLRCLPQRSRNIRQ